MGQHNLQPLISKSLFSICTISVIIAALVSMMVPQHITHASHSGCDSIDWEVGGMTGNFVHFYGVAGYNTVWDASAPGSYINGAVVQVDSNNQIEIGWHKQGDTYQYNLWIVDNGRITHLHPGGTPTIGTHHFTVTNFGDSIWHYLIDGNEVHTVDLSFDKGIPAAFRERHNACDSIWGHWWSLNRCDLTGQCQLWNNHLNLDSDPHSYPNFVSDYEFYAQSN